MFSKISAVAYPLSKKSVFCVQRSREVYSRKEQIGSIMEKKCLPPRKWSGSLVSGALNTGSPEGVPEGGTTEDASLWWPSAIRSGLLR